MRRLSVLFAAITILVALPAFAFAFFSRPSDLMTLSKFNGQPMDFSGELHASYQDTFASLWFSGSSQGKTLDTAKTSLKVTVDVKSGADTVRAKVQVRLSDRKLYVFVESIAGNLSHDLPEEAAQVVGKKWLMVTLPPEEASSPVTGGLTEAQVKDLIGRLLDAALSLKRMTSQNQVTYSLSLQPNAADNIWQAVQSFAQSHSVSQAEMPSLDDLAKLREALTHVNLHVKVQTDAQDNFLSSKYYLSVDDQGYSLVMQGISKARLTPVTVEVPHNVMDLDERLQPYETMPSSGSSEFPAMMSSSSAPAWMTEQSSAGGYLQTCPGDTPSEQLSNARSGLCQTTRMRPPRSR